MCPRLLVPAFLPVVAAGLFAAFVAAPGPSRRQPEPANLVRLRDAYLSGVTHRGLIARYERDGEYSGTLWVGRAWTDAPPKKLSASRCIRRCSPTPRTAGLVAWC